MDAVSSKPKLTEGLFDPATEKRRLKLYDALGDAKSQNAKLGYEAGKKAAQGDMSGVQLVSQLLSKQ